MDATICALSTATGGALGIIRVSGKDAVCITEMIFHSANGKKLTDAKPNTLHYGEIYDNTEMQTDKAIDDVVVSIFRAPHSYSGEDSVEISCHGSQYILNKVLQLLIQNGCRQAEPGEFTKRAFLNGKMDLSQAEAVADLIASTSKAAHDVALSQLKGNISNELATLREHLLRIASLVELELDFSEEDVNFAERQELLALAKRIHEKISSLLHSFQTGKTLKEGIPVAIVGKTNVGKSTIINRLLHDDKAIVSDIHGTTRDAIEDTTIINGVTFRFIDTAGLRETTDTIENIGIQLTHKKILQASIILWVVDTPPTAEEIEEMQNECVGKQLILLFNKSDINPATSSVQAKLSAQLHISAKYDNDISVLEQTIYQAANLPDISENDVIVTNTRHYEALLRAETSIVQVIKGLNENISGDLLAEDIRHCTHILAEITGGEIQSTDILNSIFSHFCIGK